MRFATMFFASSLLLGLALGIAAGCGGHVITGTGGNGSGGASGFTACGGPGQCVLVNSGCCDTCGEADLTTMVAINAAQADAFHHQICPVEPPCVACDTIPNPNYFAYCDNGTCRAADVRTEDVSACATDADCTLRYGTGCCEGCGGDGDGLIAVSKSNDLYALVCGGDVGCPACAPIYPPDAAAICSAGHCEVVLAGFDSGG